MTETQGFDPLSKSITIASACNKVFRRNFLEEETIGIVPNGGYRKKEKQSAQALRYLKWISEDPNQVAPGHYIQHALNLIVVLGNKCRWTE